MWHCHNVSRYQSWVNHVLCLTVLAPFPDSFISYHKPRQTAKPGAPSPRPYPSSKPLTSQSEPISKASHPGSIPLWIHTPLWNPAQSTPTLDQNPKHPTLDPYPKHPTLDPYPKHPTLDPYPKHPTLDPNPRHPTLDPTLTHPTVGQMNPLLYAAQHPNHC